jgi:hypothetical protein
MYPPNRHLSAEERVFVDRVVERFANRANHFVPTDQAA